MRTLEKRMTSSLTFCMVASMLGGCLTIMLGTGCLGDSGPDVSDSAQFESIDDVRPDADARPVDDADAPAASPETAVSNSMTDDTVGNLEVTPLAGGTAPACIHRTNHSLLFT